MWYHARVYIDLEMTESYAKHTVFIVNILKLEIFRGQS